MQTKSNLLGAMNANVQPMFNYHEAFSRNLGWTTEAEQELLRHKRVAIAGMGGVGGSHLLTLARLGIGNFHIADFDSFELPNFNRQAGATISSLHQPKVDVLARLAVDINPELEIRQFPKGVQPENIDDFLQGVDIYVDGLDFFAFDARQMVFAACHERGIPAVTVAPLGMGAALINFLPGRMSFDRYFALDSARTDTEKGVRFFLGLAPAKLQMRYLVDSTRVNFIEQRGPSTGIGCQLCAGIAAAEALKILLGRGKVSAAPWGVHFDAYLNRIKRTWLPWGLRSPLHQAMIKLVLKRFERKNA